MKKVEFVKSVFNVKDLPKLILPEIIFAGRSNVGKSSFINYFLNSKIALTSSTPGKTRSINYFKIDERFYLVDLPGFGYSKAGKDISNKWVHLLNDFFNVPNRNRIVLHLVDSRHLPTQLDSLFKEMITQYPVEYIILLTKIDKLSGNELTQNTKRIVSFKDDLSIGENVFPVSTVKNVGRNEINKLIESFIKNVG